MQVLPQPYDQASVTRDGLEITRYHFGKGLHRPFLFPLVGPSQRSVTRMGHPRDPNTHSHHNSVWVSHHDVNGVNFWADSGKGRIVHRRIARYEDLESEAIVEAINTWQDEAGRILLEEQRRMRVLPLANDEFLLVLDLDLRPKLERVTLGKTPFGLVGVRMAKTIGVHDGGGLIRNSEGGENEEGVFWKPAKWVDYSGPITPTASEGVTLFDHPLNPNHPTIFHVRNDGWMGTSLTHAQALEIPQDKPLHLRYGLYVHAGIPGRDALQKKFQLFAELGEPVFETPPK